MKTLYNVLIAVDKAALQYNKASEGGHEKPTVKIYDNEGKYIVTVYSGIIMGEIRYDSERLKGEGVQTYIEANYIQITK